MGDIGDERRRILVLPAKEPSQPEPAAHPAPQAEPARPAPAEPEPAQSVAAQSRGVPARP